MYPAAAASTAATESARVLYFDLLNTKSAEKADVFADFLSELEAEPASAAELADGRRWVAEQFYSGHQTLASLRLAAGMSQKQLGLATGMKQAHISRYESGSLEPRLSTAHSMAQALGVDLDTYFKAWDATANTNQGTP